MDPQFSLIHSAFNDFLFASVGEEKTGMQLTVLSALTRLGLDPWGEAARLSNLPKETAARALAAAISLLPEGDWKIADLSAIAARLVDCLPARGAPAGRSPRSVSRINQRTKSWAAIFLLCMVLFAIALFAISHLQAASPSIAPESLQGQPRETM